MKHTYGVFFVIAAVFIITVAVVVAANDIDEYRSCNICGMDRKAYGYSRMIVDYTDGARIGVCSLHCAVTEIDANKGRDVASLLVADRDSRSLLDAGKAIWVIGGKKRGVMTQRAKWAFATKDAAQSFVNSFGGEVTSWKAVLLATHEELDRQHNKNPGKRCSKCFPFE